MKVLFNSLLIVILTTAALAADKPGQVLEDYYRFSQEENLAAYYNVIDIQSMGPRELKTRKSLTRTLWQRFDTLEYDIKDLHIEQDGDTAIAGYRLRAKISGPDDSGRTAQLETDQKQVALLVLRASGWKVALVSDEASFYINLQNIFLQRQMAFLKPTEKTGIQTAESTAATPGQSNDIPAKDPQSKNVAVSPPDARPHPVGLPDAAAAGGVSIQLNKESYRPSEQIIVDFNALADFADDAWIGIIPSAVPHGSEVRNDGHDISYQYLRKKTAGRLTFAAPNSPGSYDLRMHDRDSHGTEVASVTFRVAGSTPGPSAGSAQAAAREYRLMAKWGGKGREDGRFSTPVDITVDGDGNVYVCDMSDRIQKFSAEGQLIKTFAGRTAKDNSGRFNRPFGLAVDPDNNVYVSDYSYNKIHKFNQELEYRHSWPQMEYNFGVTADAAGNIYVAEKRSNRLRKFDPDGKQLAVIGAAGNGAGRLADPYDVALDRDGNIFVVEQEKNRIQKLDPRGNHLAQWGARGSQPGKFNSPNYLAVDGAGYVYVSDSGNRRVQKFDNNGNFVCQIGDPRSKAEAVGDPAGIAVDAAGNIYVVDSANHQVKKYAPVN